ncbi:probable serine/threonine-protein kinase roco6 [Mytilus edulis]|uniref:probable serine/threonine-protein kinase roco6 n=1 Tax=Mytilus edulis TaxID=6550 RepID=UPI0039EF5AAD
MSLFRSNNTDDNAVQLIELSRTNYTNAQKVAYIIIACLADDEKQKFLHELFLKGECGKLHFARLVFIGKHGVGKTSLMRRLLWQKKEDVTSTKSTDGIEVEKCNINIVDGKWSPCKETDDHVRRLIHQVFKGKILNVERKAMETINDQKHFSSNEDGPRSDSNKEPSTSFDERDTINIFNDDSKGESNASDDIVDIQTVISDNKDNHVMVNTGLNLMPPDSFKLENIYDSDINHLTKQSESDPINDENINEMTSTILKSYLQLKEKEQDDMLAFCWLWDFAGQKDFYATHQVFLSKHAVFLLVTDSLEFTIAENQGENFVSSAQYVSFWFDAIHCYWSTAIEGRLDPPIIVVCTNEDKFKKREREKRQTKFKENLNHVLKKQEKKRHLRNIYFISNTEDPDIVFEKIRKEISRQAMTMKDWGKDCPLKWLLFQRVLMKLKDNNVPISSTKALLKIAKHKDIDIREDNEVKQCLQYCHDIGTIVYFDEKKIEDYVILDPKWLINAFRCLVSDKIENIIEVSDDWQTLTDTGQLTYSLISLLFRKEPELKFEENKEHLIEVMKRFDIIVNLKDSTELYMPCMVKSCSFSEVQKQFSDGSQSTQKTSWLCLEFKFLPPAFFNHIIAWYIKQYNVSVILDKQSRRKRNALYRQVGVFDLDPSGCEQLVVCEGPNIIALQVWDSRMSNKTYGDLGSDLFRFVKTLRKRYSVDIPYSNTFTCTDGDFTIHRKSIEDLLTRDYRCLEHNTNHFSDDLVRPWNFSEELK